MTSREVTRRRRIAVAAMAIAALLAGVAVGAGGGDDAPGGREAARPAGDQAQRVATPRPAEPRDLRAARRLSLTQRAGTLVVLRFQGTETPGYVERALRRRWAGGVILFRDNVTTAAALRAMTRSIRRASGGRALISVDQEGGSVRRIPFAGPSASQSTLGTPVQAAAESRAGARDLRALGINVNLAPVADVAASRTSVVRDRAYPGGTAAVARAVRAAVRAYRGTGVAPTLKHFPGIGATTANTDDRSATIERPAREIGAVDLPPFRAGVAAGAPLVMTSHALYPALDRRRIASQSPAVHRLLRDGLGFEGVIVTDSLEAAAVRVRGGAEKGAVRSLRAGADLLLTTGKGSHLRVLRAIIAEGRRSKAARDRITESAARVIALQRRLAQDPEG